MPRATRHQSPRRGMPSAAESHPFIGQVAVTALSISSRWRAAASQDFGSNKAARASPPSTRSQGDQILTANLRKHGGEFRRAGQMPSSFPFLLLPPIESCLPRSSGLLSAHVTPGLPLSCHAFCVTRETETLTEDGIALRSAHLLGLAQLRPCRRTPGVGVAGRAFVCFLDTHALKSTGEGAPPCGLTPHEPRSNWT